MVVRRGDPKVLRLVVRFLRAVADLTQEEFGRRSRVSQSDVSRFEGGLDVPSEEAMRRMAETAGVPWPVVGHVTHFFAAVLETAAGKARTESGAARLDRSFVDSVLLAVAPYLLEEEVKAQRKPSPQEECLEASEIWAVLEKLPMHRRRELIELAPQRAWSCALVAQVCDASERSAAHKPAEALDLADLARFIAERVPDEGRRSRALAYALGFIANARRVANDFHAADVAFRQAWELWKAGTATEPDPLAEWRLLDLEASLRREQHRFSEALERLSRATTLSGADSKASGRILMKRSNIMQKSGDFAAALAALEDAALTIEGSGDANLMFGLRFNQATNLGHLERYEEAAALLPQVRELAAQQGNELSSIRVQWLEARVAGAQGKKEDAMILLGQVVDAFTSRKLPYEAALASLELAVLWLERGRTAEVRELAVGMMWIFQAQGIHREALAALTVFCEAAKQEAATVEMTRRIIADVENARRVAAPR
jgi:transcriptional regulator with XRE-family HTH domain